MEQIYKHTELFLTHTWRKDLYGRDNHARVRIVNEYLNRLGYLTWFDEKSMSGDIEAKMAEGIDFTKCVLVFVTEQYMQKIDVKDKDNCKYEFDRAVAQKTGKNMLCLVMEEKFNDPKMWFGKLKQTLGNCLFVSLSGNLDDKHYLKQQLQLVVDQLKAKGVAPSQTKQRCEGCIITNKNGEKQPLFGDGNACTYCGEDLQKTTDPKNYCVGCTLHTNGSFCNICKMHLLDKNERIHDLEELLFSLISLESNIDLDMYDVEKFKAMIKKMKQQLCLLQEKRNEVQTSGVKLHIGEKDFENNVVELQKKMDSLMSNTTTLSATKDKYLQCLEPSYKEKLLQFKDWMSSLEEERKELAHHTSDISKAMEELKELEKQVVEFENTAVEGEQHIHDKNCSCENCVFEQEVTSVLITEPKKYIKSLIIADEIEKFKKVFNLKREIENLKDENGVNLILSYTLQYGTVDMLIMLVENKIHLDNNEMEKAVQLNKKNIITNTIRGNNIEDMKKFIAVWVELLGEKECKELCLLILCLTMQYGTVDMLILLLENKIHLDKDEITKSIQRHSSHLITKIISDNNFEQMKKFIAILKDLSGIKEDKELSHLLLPLTLQQGTFDMLIMLLERGIHLDIERCIELANGVHLIEKIMEGNKVDELRKIIELQRHIMNAKNKKGSNFLMLLTLSHGTLDLYTLLLEMGMHIDTEEMKNMIKSCSSGLIKKIISDNKLEDMKKFIAIWRDLLGEKEDKELSNLLLPLTLQQGTLDMLIMLLERGLHLDIERCIELANGVHLIEKIMEGNKVHELCKIIELQRHIMNAKNKKGSNFLMLLTLSHGTLDLYTLLLEMGMHIDNEEMKSMIKSCSSGLIKKIISDNKLEDMKKFIAIWRDLLGEKEDKELSNLLLPLTLQQGTLDMLIMLLERGLHLDIERCIELANGVHLIEKIMEGNKVHELCKIIELQRHIMIAKNKKGFNLLMSLTLSHGTLDLFTLLLEMGLHIDTEEMKNMILCYSSGLINIIINENKLEDMKKMIELRNEIVDVKSKTGFNLLLFLTVLYGKIEMLEMLLEKGLEADTVDTNNKTLLHHMNNADIAKFLCEKHGDVMLSVKDKEEGFTPLVKAYHYNKRSVVEVFKCFVNAPEEELKNYDIIGQLKKKGFDYIEHLIGCNNITVMSNLLTLRSDVISMRNWYEYTPFLWCCMCGSIDMLKLLEKCGSDIKACDDNGSNALMMAIVHNGTQWCEAVMEHLCNNHPPLLTMENICGESVFHYAAKIKSEKLVPILLNSSPPPLLLEKKDVDDRTPIDVAKRNECKAIVEMYEGYLNKNNN